MLTPGERHAARIRAFRAAVARVGAYAAVHPVFRAEDLDAALGIRDAWGRALRSRAVCQLVRRGVLTRISKWAYGVTAELRGGHLRGRMIDDLAAAAVRDNRDAVIAYRSALALHGVLPRRPEDEIIVVSASGWERAERYGVVRIRRMDPPRTVVQAGQSQMGVEWKRLGRSRVPVTGPERTFVDALCRPQHTGSWEEIVRGLAALVSRYQMDWELLVAYAEVLGERTAAARVGWVLDRGGPWNGVPEEILARLEGLGPAGPRYWASAREQRRALGGRYSRRWRVVVPKDVALVMREINRAKREGDGVWRGGAVRALATGDEGRGVSRELAGMGGH